MRIVAGLALVLCVFGIIVFSSKMKTFAAQLTENVSPSEQATTTAVHNRPTALTASLPTELPATVSKASSTPEPATTASVPPIATFTLTLEPTYTPTAAVPTTYVLQKGEYPYCIARRFNIDPNELIILNKLRAQQSFYAGMVLKIPQGERTFPENRVLQTHPATYTVATSNETIYSVACLFGDADPRKIAQTNNISIDSQLAAGQQLNIP